MALTATPNTDAHADLAKGKAYPILGFASSTVLVLDDKSRLQHVSYVKLNDDKLWTLADTDAKAKADAKAEADAAAKTDSGPAVSQGLMT